VDIHCPVCFMYAQIAFPGTGFKTFTYKIPEHLLSLLTPGQPVVAPFKNRTVAGVVHEISGKSELPDEKIKQIRGIIDTVFAFTAEHVILLNWIADYYICPVGDVFKAAYPPGVLGKSRLRVCAGEIVPSDSKQKFVYDKIKIRPEGYLYSRRDLIISGVSNSLVEKMIKTGFLYLSADFGIHKSRIRLIVRLKSDIEKLSPAAQLTKRRKELIDFLINYPEGIALAKLAAFGFSRGLVEGLNKDGLIDIEKKSDEAVVLPDIKRSRQIILNKDQQKAVEAVTESLERNDGQTFLLFGITGSGKTQVYIEAARKALALGKSVLILLPEISLTPQAIERFSRALDCPIGLWHSRITAGQRADVYRRAKTGEIKVILGVRSAVFVPLVDPGLIVVDEEQDDSFKQSEPPPRYNARDAALMRAKIEGITTILGSATPSLESYFNAETGKYQLLRLPQRFSGGKLPKAYAIDLKSVEVDQKLWPLSEEFIERLCLNIADEKQVIILLNRRGYSGILMCRACGYVALCPDCKVAQTYHKPGRLLRCHYCGLTSDAPDICPECSGATFEYRGIGTQKLEELLIEILGDKGIIRMDSDSTARKGALEKIISTFEIGEKPILLGTKMVAKGHHFPQVGMVGVVLADAGLHLPDFRASEKVFQLLVQAAGRAGRSENTNDDSEFVVQTYDPSSGILGYAAEQDYEVFYKNELKYRRELNYPPFGKIIRLVFSGEDDSLTRWAARKSAREFAVNLKTGKVLGPAATGVFRLGNKYHYQIVLKGRFSADFRKMLKDFIISEHPGKAKGVLVKIDVDPREMV